jgi:16S rRNA (cytosine967-C5)-methyltransferase
VQPKDLASLRRLQTELLDGCADVVAAGALLVYSTCSLEPEENQVQVERFLARHPEFEREPAAGFPAELLSSEGDLMIVPQKHGIDGAYAARLRRRA